jgi:hypothetical protein
MLISTSVTTHDRQTGCQGDRNNTKGSCGCKRPSRAHLAGHCNCGDRHEGIDPRRAEHSQPPFNVGLVTGLPDGVAVASKHRKSAPLAAVFCPECRRKPWMGHTMVRSGDTGGGRVRTIRSVISLGLAAALVAVMTSPLLGYEHPSPRLPGHRRGSPKITECPFCEGTVREKPNGKYSCSTCGRSFDELPQRE